jgi:hypothetical protein
VNEKTDLKKTDEFWKSYLSGWHFVSTAYPSRGFYETYRVLRYQKTHHLSWLADRASEENRNVLEIGPGIGADSARRAERPLAGLLEFHRFVRAGKRF